MTPENYLDECKRKLNMPSDYQLAKKIDWSTGALCDVRKGKRPIPPIIAYKIGEILGIDGGAVMADLEAQQEKDPKKRAYWKSFLNRAAAATLVIAFGIITCPNNAQARIELKHECVLCQVIGQELTLRYSFCSWVIQTRWPRSWPRLHQ